MSSREHAIVIGGGMAGMLAGRVLANHYRRVTIIDRDNPMTAGVPRRGVPQACPTHGLPASGGVLLEQLFPGIARELWDAGAIPTDAVRDGRRFHQGGYLARPSSGMNVVPASRPLSRRGGEAAGVRDSEHRRSEQRGGGSAGAEH